MQQEYASPAAMSQWAKRLMLARQPDAVIGPRKDPYLLRWWVVPRNEFGNCYLHKILRSDDDRALHDHPWRNTSFVIEGRYIEHTPEGSFERTAGSLVEREATALHRLEVPNGEYCITLFWTGPVVREWGFACPQGWVHWRDFTDAADSGLIGKGCGE